MVISIIDTDFEPFISDAAELLNRLAAIPKSKETTIRELYAVKTLKAFMTLAKFKDVLSELVAVTIDISDGKVDVKERYRELVESGNPRYLRCKERIGNIRIGGGLDALGYYSEDICALAFLEFQYMCVNGFGIRKCDSCGGYFLPYHGNAVYCGRVNPDIGKSCREFAALEKYKAKYKDDDAAALLMRWKNTQNMRRQRNKANSRNAKKDYLAWRANADLCYEKVKNNEMTLEEFIEKVEPKKLH